MTRVDLILCFAFFFLPANGCLNQWERLGKHTCCYGKLDAGDFFFPLIHRPSFDALCIYLDKDCPE